MKKKIFLLAVFGLIAVASAQAAINITFNADTTVSDITFGATTTALKIFATSSAESANITAGAFTVLNPGTFKVGSASSTVGSIEVRLAGAIVACANNSTPGTSFVTLPTGAGTYTVSPAASNDCTAHCPVLSNVATYNAFPTCGAATCASGYSVAGSGATATCAGGAIAVTGGGGGSPAPDPNNSTTATQSYQATQNYTISSETKTTKENGIVTQVTQEASITPLADIAQNISLKTFINTEIKEFKLELSKEIINEITAAYGKNYPIKVNVISRSATDEQKTSNARGDMYMIGFDIFSVAISVNNTPITSFTNPLTFSFDVSAITEKTQTKAYYFDPADKKWKIYGSGGAYSSGWLTVASSSLRELSVMRPLTATSATQTTADSRVQQWQQITTEGGIVEASGQNLNEILSYNGVAGDTAAQTAYMDKYTKPLITGLTLSSQETSAINNFILYGTKTTKILGAGERAGVVNSYKKAFGKLPRTENEWIDCIAIGNGRWPREASQAALDKAKIAFKKIYLRDANMSQPNDNAAVTVMAYGLRPANRNLNSEKTAILSFKYIYKYSPTSALDWDSVRAIAYSGAKR